MTELSALRIQYRADKAALLSALSNSGASTRGVHAALHKLAALADGLLKNLWQRAGLTEPFALAAVGGFGRRELFPHSDVDVLLLLPDDQSPDDDAALKARLEGFIGSCWDAGLEIGSSVRTVSTCLSEAHKDVTVQTSLLEARLITGSAALFGDFQKRFMATMDPQAFFIAKTLELNQRHNKYDNTPYSLEPNCKESPGGLRDLQVILWVAKASGYGNNRAEFAKNGLSTAFEVKQLRHNEALL